MDSTYYRVKRARDYPHLSHAKPCATILVKLLCLRMNSAETLIWAAHAGAYAMLILCAAVVATRHRTTSSALLMVWVGACGLGVLAVNGLLKVIAPDISPEDYQKLHVMAGPSCVALSALFMRDWLGSRQRNRVIDFSVMGITPACILMGAVCLWMPAPYALFTAGLTAVLGIIFIVGLCIWAALQGDRLAWLAALGSSVFALVVTGHYGLALGLLQGVKANALVAVCSAAITLVLCVLLWERSRKESLTQQNNSYLSSKRDPLTGLDNGITIIKHILAAQKRLQLRNATGEILAVMVFDFESLVRQIGPGGAQELLARLGARISREIGLINPVGRFYDRCYIVLLETAVSPTHINSQVTALTKALSLPMNIMGMHGENHAIVLNVGVGRALLNPQVDVANVLDRAQRSARFAAHDRTPHPSTSQPVPFQHSALDSEVEAASESARASL